VYSIILLSVSGICYVTWQLILTFFSDPIEYYAVACVFIAANGIVMTILIFFVLAKDGLSINKIISDLPEGEKIEYPEDDRPLA
jgi:hypothetical protein